MAGAADTVPDLASLAWEEMHAAGALYIKDWPDRVATQVQRAPLADPSIIGLRHLVQDHVKKMLDTLIEGTNDWKNAERRILCLRTACILLDLVSAHATASLAPLVESLCRIAAFPEDNHVLLAVCLFLVICI